MLPATRSTPERQVLGAALDDPASAASLVLLIPDEAFERSEERRLYRAIAKCLERRVRPDIVSVCDVDRELSPAFVSDIYSEAAGGQNVEYFGRVVLESHMRRRIRRLGHTATALPDDSDPFDTVASLQRDLASVLVSESLSTDAASAVASLAELIAQHQRGETPDAIATGFSPLDQRVIGWPKANLSILASTSGMGKTTFVADQVKRYCARTDAPPPALVVSAEMTAREFLYRLATNIANVDGDQARKGKARPEQYEAMRYAARKVADTGLLHIDDTPRPSLRRIHAVAMRLHVEHGAIGPIIVDYDQKLDPPDRRVSKEEQVFDINQGLKDIAKEFDTAVISLSQYTEEDRPKWPSDGNLRYSKGKFHEAATVVHWYWPHYWRRKGYTADAISLAHPAQAYEGPRHAWVVYTKNRFGSTGFFPCKFEAETGRIEHLPSTLLEKTEAGQLSADFTAPNDDVLPF